MTSPDPQSPLVSSLQPKLVPCRIREFHPDDFDACLDIHRSNEPDLLLPAARAALAEFLEHGTSYILVVEQDGRLIACAALELTGDAEVAKLYHSMVHRDFHGRGFGTTLLAARLSLLESEDGKPVHVLLRARPQPAAFYGAYGFVLHTLEQDQGTAILRLSLSPEDIAGIRSALNQAGVEIVLNEDPAADAETATAE